MDEKKTAKISALVISCIIISLSLVHISDYSAVGIFKDCGLLRRAIYPFFHANFFHAALNAWCLLSLVFFYNLSLCRLAIAYFIAISIPDCCLFYTPTVGISGVVFALFGSISFEVQRKTYYQLWMIAYLVLGFFFPNTNAWIHIYCYFFGLVAAFFIKPIKIK